MQYANYCEKNLPPNPGNERWSMYKKEQKRVE